MPDRISSDTDRGLPGEPPTARFARVIRTAREQRGWNQEELAAHADVSRPTIQRFENGKTSTPQPESARKVFRALGLDPRLIPVILGYVTAEEMDVELPEPEVLTPTEEEALRILKDRSVPAAVKREWLEFLRFRAQASRQIEPGQAS